MADLGKKISSFFKAKVARKNEDDAAKKSGIPKWITKMPEGSDKDRAMAVHRANMKRKRKMK